MVGSSYAHRSSFFVGVLIVVVVLTVLAAMSAVVVASEPTDAVAGSNGAEAPLIRARARAGLEGASWEKQHTPTQFALYGIDFVDDMHGWAVGGEGRDNEKDAAIRTVDGGKTWSHMDLPGARRLQAVSFVNASSGWVVGDFGQLYRTRDGGATWQKLNPGTDIKLTSVYFVDEQTGWMTGRDTVVFKTTDSGDSWTSYESDSKGHLSRVFFLNKDRGWSLGGDGEILHSSDGGVTWTHQNIPTKRRLYGVFFSDSEHGWTVGSDMFGTTDGGKTWAHQYHPRKSMRDVAFANEAVGWAVGDEGVVVRSRDGGATWEEEQTGLGRNALNALSIVGRAHLWACGVKGTVIHRYDPAAAITPTPTPTNTPTATSTPTPAPTATPTGPWVDIGDPAQPILVPSAGEARVVAVFGNMPSTILITGTVTGAAIFDNGEKLFTDTLLRLSGAGEYPFVLQPAPDAAPGALFDLDLQVERARASRHGAVAWSALLPLALRHGAPRGLR
jgi:photosystem II stability/assembly factor-like uncharacterized protein